MIVRLRVSITGIVQGVGFRPHVHKLAEKYKIRGWVLNNSAGVTMEIEPPEGKGRAHLVEFIKAIVDEKPPLSLILSVETTDLPYIGFDGFEIQKSERIAGELTLISPDTAICEDCKRELFTVSDRRYGYPFINCTNCGPRYSIIRGIPYDRPLTTMSGFAMCADCAVEYRDVNNRRYHAQPNCCAVCGPRVSYIRAANMILESNAIAFTFERDNALGRDAILEAARAIATGEIVAVKGIGGFHLACDAANAIAVAALRSRKKRAYEKPFAIMVRDIDTVKLLCDLSTIEEQLLMSQSSPIVLLKKKSDDRSKIVDKEYKSSLFSVVDDVAPSQNTFGIMLAYTPLHLVLLSEVETITDKPAVLVMTSANISEEPLVSDNEEAFRKLSDIADGFLIHNRDIYAKCDDSVARVVASQPQLIRHSRGYSPFPISFKSNGPPVFAVGAQKKSTFTTTRERFAFLSPHMGDMENLETLDFFERTFEHYAKLFTIKPDAIACDMHPDYLITQWAQDFSDRNNIPLFQVQHHHAHMSAVLAEHGIDDDAIGVCFDGTGLGDDGSLWGGEFLIGNTKSFSRYAHFLPMRLPGGESAIREPWRVALACLHELEDRDRMKLGCDILKQYLELNRTNYANRYSISLDCVSPFDDVNLMLNRNLNCVETSSCGRLFDAVSALCGLCLRSNYEGQAAILLEQVLYTDSCTSLNSIANDNSASYQWDWIDCENPKSTAKLIFDWRPLIESVISDVIEGTPQEQIAERFHRTIVDLIVDAVQRLSVKTGIKLVTLSGGCFQNAYLVESVNRSLSCDGYKALWGCFVPSNDAGVSLGQAAIIRSKLL